MGSVGQNILPFSMNQPINHSLQNQSVVEFDPELNHQISNATDEMKKIDLLLKHLLDSKKISKKQLLQRLIQIGDKEDHTEDNLMNENILADSQDDSSQAPNDASHRHAISNTNSSFYNFRNQEGPQHERPKSSKGGFRQMMPPTSQGPSVVNPHQRTSGKNSLAGQREASKTAGESRNDSKIHSNTQLAASESQKQLAVSRGGKRVESV
jgi:hypothetical protein